MIRLLAIAAFLLLIMRIGIIPIQIAMPTARSPTYVQYQSPQPQAIFVLGGGREREKAATELLSLRLAFFKHHLSLNLGWPRFEILFAVLFGC